MVQMTGRALVAEQILKLAPNVKESVRATFERSELGARRFSRMVKWRMEPRVHISKSGCVTLRFIEIGVSMTALIFLDHDTVDYRASTERKGVDYAPYCQGIDTPTNALIIIRAFGVEMFSAERKKE
jgi:hypothetical protein